MKILISDMFGKVSRVSDNRLELRRGFLFYGRSLFILVFIK